MVIAIASNVTSEIVRGKWNTIFNPPLPLYFDQKKFFKKRSMITLEYIYIKKMKTKENKYLSSRLLCVGLLRKKLIPRRPISIVPPT